MRGHSRTSLAVPPRHRFCSRLPRRLHFPETQIFGDCDDLQIPAGYSKAWHHDSEDQRHRASRSIHRCRLEWPPERREEHLGRNTPDWVNNAARIHERSQFADVVKRRGRTLRRGDDDRRDITYLQRRIPIKLRLRSGSTGHHPAARVRSSHEERKFVVDKEPTQTNAANGVTNALQTAKYLEWRNRLGMGHDNGKEADTSKREALSKPALHAVPGSVLIATLLQLTYGTRKNGWNDWKWLRKT